MAVQQSSLTSLVNQLHHIVSEQDQSQKKPENYDSLKMKVINSVTMNQHISKQPLTKDNVVKHLYPIELVEVALSISDVDRHDARFRHKGNRVLHARELLGIWQNKNGLYATFLHLLNTLERHKLWVMAEKLLTSVEHVDSGNQYHETQLRPDSAVAVFHQSTYRQQSSQSPSFRAQPSSNRQPVLSQQAFLTAYVSSTDSPALNLQIPQLLRTNVLTEAQLLKATNCGFFERQMTEADIELISYGLISWQDDPNQFGLSSADVVTITTKYQVEDQRKAVLRFWKQKSLNSTMRNVFEMLFSSKANSLTNYGHEQLAKLIKLAGENTQAKALEKFQEEIQNLQQAKCFTEDEFQQAKHFLDRKLSEEDITSLAKKFLCYKDIIGKLGLEDEIADIYELHSKDPLRLREVVIRKWCEINKNPPIQKFYEALFTSDNTAARRMGYDHISMMVQKYSS